MSYAPMIDPSHSAVSEDAVLGGRLRLRQPLKGHRAGHDAILLAAAVEIANGDRAIDLGAGVGTAGLALAARISGASVALVERDPQLAALAGDNIKLNGLTERATAHCLDVMASAADFVQAGLEAHGFDAVLMNPPFNPGERFQASPDLAREAAHRADEALPGAWIKVAARLLRPKGSLTLIWRADGLAEVLDALGRGWGGVAVRPVYPSPGAHAIRVLVRARRASRAPLAILPGVMLEEAAGQPSRQATDILRHGQPLPMS